MQIPTRAPTQIICFNLLKNEPRKLLSFSRRTHNYTGQRRLMASPGPVRTF